MIQYYNSKEIGDINKNKKVRRYKYVMRNSGN